MIGALLAAGALMLPTPSPTPKTITIVRASPLCAAVHDVLPKLWTVLAHNTGRFSDMGRNIRVGMHWGDGPNFDLARANVDWYASQSDEELAGVDALLAKSYRDSPAGRDPQLDDLRKRAQLLVDTQRVIIDAYGSFAAERTVSLKYWNSILREADEVHRLDGDPDPLATPIPSAAGNFAWIAREMNVARDSLAPVAFRAARSCGDR
jgi:hypothetical protein